MEEPHTEGPSDNALNEAGSAELDTESDKTARYRAKMRTVRTIVWCIAAVLVLAPPWKHASQEGCSIKLEPADKQVKP